jgi:hypothetical protein
VLATTSYWTDASGNPRAAARIGELSVCQRLHCMISMLTIASRLDVMNRLGRAMADPTRSRI